MRGRQIISNWAKHMYHQTLRMRWVPKRSDHPKKSKSMARGLDPYTDSGPLGEGETKSALAKNTTR